MYHPVDDATRFEIMEITLLNDTEHDLSTHTYRPEHTVNLALIVLLS